MPPHNAIEWGLKTGDKMTWGQAKLYLKPLTNLYITEPATLGIPNPNHLDWAPDPFVDPAPFTVDAALPTPAGTSALFGDTIAQEFWSPFPLQ